MDARRCQIYTGHRGTGAQNNAARQQRSKVQPPEWRSLNDRLVATLKPFAPPVAISFLAEDQAVPAARLDDAYPEPNKHGRTGQVSAGCVFWIRGADTSFATNAADHANCSVGSFTHGFLTLEEAATKDDVCAVLESGWVDEAAIGALPVVANRPASVVYGPLVDAQADPDVVLLRIQRAGVDDVEERLSGPTDRGQAAVPHRRDREGAGCDCGQRRVCVEPVPNRYEGRGDDMRHPGQRLGEIVEALESTVTLDRAMASYASEDAKRFS